MNAPAMGRHKNDDYSRLILAFAQVLFVNGQATEKMLADAAQLANALGLQATLLPSWGELEIHIDDDGSTVVSRALADPVGVNMDRVIAATHIASEIRAGRLEPIVALASLEKIAQKPPTPTWMFALAAAVGAVSLGVIFGLEHQIAAALIFASAALGAIVRRVLARWTDNLFIQPFVAALLAGIIGALAVHYQLSSTLRLIAVCPCMVLVPGPHILNGALDFVKGRMLLGAARTIYATLIVAAISLGLLLGFALFGTSLPIDPQIRVVPLWQDMIAAALAVGAYSIFFSTPLRLLFLPMLVGMCAHALRWVALALAATTSMGAFLACVLVSLIITPVARRSHTPFAAIGFASVVSMIPGVFLFRMASGLVQVTSRANVPSGLLRATIADGMTATMIVVAMSLGLIIPKLLIDYVSDRDTTTKSRR